MGRFSPRSGKAVQPGMSGSFGVESAAMNHSRLTAQRLVALFLLGCLLFNFPLLALFNRSGEVLGIPILYAYIFGVWLVLIALMALAAERRR
jgi:predicted permease